MQRPDRRMVTTTREVVQTVLPAFGARVTELFGKQRVVEGLKECILCPGDWKVGRGVEGCLSITLPDDGIASRVHASLHVGEPLESGSLPVDLVDAQSINGTYVNGERITRRRLQDNDIIRMGGSLLHFRLVPRGLEDEELPGLLGQSPAMMQVREDLLSFAQSCAPILLEGETGTGKEEVSKALHSMWKEQGRKGPHVKANCGAIPKDLVVSALFGHVRGAFSDAKESNIGLFRAADGGTLFLDEIGELPLDAQPSLLRVLEERCVAPVGREHQPIPVDVRIVAATNRTLSDEVQVGRFRQDLLSRLDALHITLPPLRERREEILRLLRHLWESALPRMTCDLAEELVLHDWPENVRGLRNMAEHLKAKARRPRAIVMDRQLLPARFPQRVSLRPHSVPREETKSLAPRPEVATASRRSAANFSTEELADMMAKNNNVIARVANQVGRSRRQVRRWLVEHGLLAAQSEP